MLGTSQSFSGLNQRIDEALGGAGIYARLQESLQSNTTTAQEAYNALQDKLSKFAEQVYKGEIKQSEAEQKYNELVAQAANKYAQDTDGLAELYEKNISSLASSIYANNQNQKERISKQAYIAEASDKMSEAYRQVAQQKANNAIQSAQSFISKGYRTYSNGMNLDYSKQVQYYMKQMNDKDSYYAYGNNYKQIIDSFNSMATAKNL
jgi:predicted translin family RNA/ssDNA-binding protein